MSKTGDAPFHLEREVQLFLSTLSDKRLINRSCLDEMESHILDEVDDLVASGCEPREAFTKAIATFGRSEALLQEYDKLFRGQRRAKLANVMSHYFDRRIVVKLLLGSVLASVFMFAGLILEGGHVSSVLQLTAFSLVAGTALGMTLFGASWQTVAYAYGRALKGDAEGEGAPIFSSIGRNFLNAGLLGAFVGLVQVVRHLHQPEQIGPALALAVVSLLYGFLGYLFFGLGFEAATINQTDSKRPLRLKKLIVPALLVLVAVLGSLRLGLGLERARQFFNLPAAFVVLAGVVAVASFVRKLDARHLPFLANGALAAGAIGSIFNFIHVMENLDVPQAIFTGLSVALLPLLYGVLIAAACRAISGEGNANTDTPAISKPQTLAPYYAATVSVLFVASGLVIYALGIQQA